MTRKHVELDAAIRRGPLDAWDTAGIARQYESFIRRWSATLPPGRRRDRRRRGGPRPYRGHGHLPPPAHSRPQRPLRLLPPGWLREPARDLFVAVYDGLAAAAEDHVRAVASRHAEGPVVGVGAHTVDDLAKGFAL